jgi:hypothetical protein
MKIKLIHLLSKSPSNQRFKRPKEENEISEKNKKEKKRKRKLRKINHPLSPKSEWLKNRRT